MNTFLKKALVFVVLSVLFLLFLTAGNLFSSSDVPLNSVHIKQRTCLAKCTHGRCLMGVCICDEGYQGPECKSKSDTDSRYSLFGIIRASGNNFERDPKGFFDNNPSRFGKYKKVRPVTKALEICGGQSPETRRLLKSRPFDLENLVLVDPKILDYTNQEQDHFVGITGRTPNLLNTQPENMAFREEFDLVIVSHGFSYCSKDGLQGMQKSYEALRPGGYFLWHSTLNDGTFGRSGSTIQFNTNFKNFFTSFFKNLWKLEQPNEDGSFEYFFIGQKPYSDVFITDYDDELLVPPSTPKEQRVMLSSILRSIRTSEVPVERTLIVGDAHKSVAELALLSTDSMQVFWFTDSEKPLEVTNEVLDRLKIMKMSELESFVEANMYSPLELIVIDGINQPRFDPARLKLLVKDSETQLIVLHEGDSSGLSGWNSRVEDKMIIQTDNEQYCLKGHMQLLTFVLYGFDPEAHENALAIIEHMSKFDVVQHIVFAWNNPDFPVPQLRPPSVNVHFTSLGSPVKSRFHMDLPISTSSVAFSGDDVKVSLSSLKCLWKQHRKQPEAITGIEGVRVTESDGEHFVMDSLDELDRGNLVSPTFMVFQTGHLDKYWSPRYSILRQYVHSQGAVCDDIFFSLVVYQESETPAQVFDADQTLLEGELPPVNLDGRSECLAFLLEQGPFSVPPTFTESSCK